MAASYVPTSPRVEDDLEIPEYPDEYRPVVHRGAQENVRRESHDGARGGGRGGARGGARGGNHRHSHTSATVTDSRPPLSLKAKLEHNLQPIQTPMEFFTNFELAQLRLFKPDTTLESVEEKLKSDWVTEKNTDSHKFNVFRVMTLLRLLKNASLVLAAVDSREDLLGVIYDAVGFHERPDSSRRELYSPVDKYGGQFFSLEKIGTTTDFDDVRDTYVAGDRFDRRPQYERKQMFVRSERTDGKYVLALQSPNNGIWQVLIKAPFLETMIDATPSCPYNPMTFDLFELITSSFTSRKLRTLHY